MAPKVTSFIPRPTTVLVAALTTALLSPAARHSTLLTVFKRFLAFVLVLNWRSFPGRWHYNVFEIGPIMWWKTSRMGMEILAPIGMSPFAFRSVIKDVVSVDQADFNMHLSNSTYAAIFDKARFKYIVELGGHTIAIEGVYAPLGRTEYNFLKEIRIGEEFEVETVLGSWDDKWWYCTSFFTTNPTKHTAGKRTLNCIATAKLCLKIQRSRLSIPPSRIFSMSGFGPRSNWERTVSLRKEKKGGRWLKYGGVLVAKKNGKSIVGKDLVGGEDGWDEDGMDEYEEERKERLEMVLKWGAGEEMKEWASL